jgi:catalase-peroxidase
MAMNDYETVALIAGGHTVGKCHGAAPGSHLGPAPEGATLEEQGLGWKNSYGTGKAGDTITSGLEGAWTHVPTQWSNQYFTNLFDYEWELGKGPGDSWQWAPKNYGEKNVPDAHDKSKLQTPIMLTTDLSLKMDPAYAPISKHFYDHPDEFADAFAKAWYKLNHRDMGPVSRLLGPQVPAPQLFQDVVPSPVKEELIGEKEIVQLKKAILNSKLSISQLVTTAWASASTFRHTDKRGGANGSRIRLEPQKNWEVNNPNELASVLKVLEQIQADFNTAKTKVSLADLIVLGGIAAVEAAAQKAGYGVKIPFKAGRMDASQDQTDIDSFAPLEPTADGFRNFVGAGHSRKEEESLIDRAHLLSLTAPEMTVLLGGMRVLNTNHKTSQHGVLTNRSESLTNDFFVNLLDMNTPWQKSSESDRLYEGRDAKTGDVKWTGTGIDLLFGSNSQLRALAEVYACDDSQKKFVEDFATAWNKVMNLDRFDLSPAERNEKVVAAPSPA